uniref:GRAS87 n=1 Tax=Arundo donax TaxID=35708 RepID=A0A0A9DPK9_ARUDO
MNGSRSASVPATRPRYWKSTRMVCANWASFHPTCCKASVSSGCGGPTPVSRNDGGPPGRRARAWRRAGHCIPCLMPKSTTWTRRQPANASRMAWFAGKWANLR